MAEENKAIPSNERLIFALDVATIQAAKRLVEELGESVLFYKIGFQLFLEKGYFHLLEWLKKKGKKVFVDLKLFDVPQTVRMSVRQLKQYDIDFLTVHGNDAILKSAVEEAGSKIAILSVTVLTSLDKKDMEDLGFKTDIKKLVLSRARRSFQLGCKGVVSSGLEIKQLRKKLGDKIIIVCPGIRPVWNDELVKNKDDQKRTVDIEEAFRNGADYLVIGRPIREHLGFKRSIAAARSIQKRIDNYFKL